MPSVSKSQFEFMQSVMQDKDIAKQRNVKQKTAREWVYSDMAQAALDPAHAALIGVKQDEALDYMAKHSDPSKEERPLSGEW